MKRTTAAVLALALVLALLPVSPALGQSVYPGYHFAFGHFEQDGFMVNGQEPIIWRVLDVDSGAGTALVLAEAGLYTMKYHRSNNRTSWGDTDVRQWLNTNFLSSFSSYERSQIVPGMVSGSWDYCFLLDEYQLQRYLSYPYLCYATPWALGHGEQGAYVNESTGASSWLLRRDVAYKKISWVGGGGALYTPETRGTNYLTTADNVVRPAMWIRLSAIGGEVWDYGFPLFAKTLISTIATRSGPSTGFNGLGSYNNIPMVKVLSRESDGSIWWLEVEFEYNSEIVRCYTGLKRVNVSISRVPDANYWPIASGTVSYNASAYYGPGTYYKRQPARLTPAAGTSGTVLKYENGWVCFEFMQQKEKVRVWLPQDAVQTW